MIMADLVVKVLDLSGTAIREWRIPMEEMPANCNTQATPRIQVSIEARHSLLADVPLPPWGDQHQ